MRPSYFFNYYRRQLTVRVVLELFSELSQSSVRRRVVSELPISCLRVVSELPKSCLRVAKEFSLSYLGVVSELPRSFLIVVSKFSKNRLISGVCRVVRS